MPSADASAIGALTERSTCGPTETRGTAPNTAISASVNPPSGPMTPHHSWESDALMESIEPPSRSANHAALGDEWNDPVDADLDQLVHDFVPMVGLRRRERDRQVGV